MRFGCNGRLRNALYHWGASRCSATPGPARTTRRSGGGGHSHGRALRGVVDRLLAMLIAMLRTGTCYDAPVARSSTPASGERNA